jgi:hypothetical protein
MIAAIDYNVCLNRNGYVNRFGERQVVVEIYQQGQRRVINTHIHVRQEDFSMGRIQPWGTANWLQRRNIMLKRSTNK